MLEKTLGRVTSSLEQGVHGFRGNLPAVPLALGVYLARLEPVVKRFPRDTAQPRRLADGDVFFHDAPKWKKRPQKALVKNCLYRV